ncbi:hypothetical protein CHLNCDRAFT_136659 [Chlorella variabilis]|uniref:Mini-chromosome maintenance complex-binding protein n=1 Tax=Chlorella variabilis TaxID=554065 RepID=E1ZKS3_CHLVA|nr:hypothetical protein CHLNCDRAFT_136659 [Chlorella variabilis]EFN53539.1 hypothetical protein CHLNCDRAFT_136659 [Chlorella variabilis]|eukprot:XP_005845641.1 hypothetical protein CHLNCDRAFT_136659 [Chlorella variabilis]
MEAITAPLQLIRSLYAAQAVGQPADGDFGVKERFSALLADPQLAAQARAHSNVHRMRVVPVLTEETVELLPNQCLVRFRGIVQDMLNPEYYVGEYRRPDGSWATAKYADQLAEPLPEGALGGGAGESRIAERRPLLLAPVPGESGWAAAPLAAVARASLATVAPAAAPAAAAKRPREDAGGDSESVSMMVSDATGQTTADDGDSAASRARRAAGAGAAGGQPQEASSSAAAPAADLPPGCCMAYVYDDAEVKLNDVVEVVGVLSRVPELAAAHLAAAGQEGQPGSMLLDDILSSHLPTSKAPRLHAILLAPGTRLPGVGCGGDVAAEAEAAPAPLPPSELAQARARALGFLSQVLGGDDVAAEYLLLQLVGRVHHRTAESAVGLQALNLVVEPNSAADAAAAAAATTPAAGSGGSTQQRQLSALGGGVAAAAAALAPRCVALPLSVAALNARPWWPRRDQATQRLVGGPLQLAGGTQALEALMWRQRVAYDFEFFSLDQPADAPVTVLSLGRSLLKDAAGVAVPLRPTAPLADASAVAAAAASADLELLRAYLAAARAADFAIPPDMETFLQQELAGARQKDRDVNERTFHAWMNLARLLALSHGEAALTRERWAAMQALEGRRLQRLKVSQEADG